MTTNQMPAGFHGFQSQCDPIDSSTTYRNFSIGFFKWQPRKGGNGVKKGKSFYRLIAPVEKRAEALARAFGIVANLDGGWMPATKSEKIK